MTSLLVALAVLANPSPDASTPTPPPDSASGNPSPETPAASQPPQILFTDDTWPCRVGQTCTISIETEDADGNDVTLSATPLPSGAVLQDAPRRHPGHHPRHDHKSFILQLKPTADQTGEYPITLTASDGRATSTHALTLEITQEWEVFAMPGVSALSYVPRATLDTGGYAGTSIECLLVSWAHRNNKQGPSHGRVYVDLDLLFPLSGHGGNLYAYTAGADLSIERNPSRRFLIPYFGAEVGGVHSALLGDYFVAVPYGGVHVWADRNAWVNVSGGYTLPGRGLDQLSGAWTKAGLNLSFW